MEKDALFIYVILLEDFPTKIYTSTKKKKNLFDNYKITKTKINPMHALAVIQQLKINWHNNH